MREKMFCAFINLNQQGSMSKPEIKKHREPSQPMSARAGLHLKIARVGTLMKKVGRVGRISVDAKIAMTAIAESVLHTVIDFSIGRTELKKRKTVTPRDIALAIQSDSEMTSLFKADRFVKTGVYPDKIIAVPLGKSKRKTIKYTNSIRESRSMDNHMAMVGRDQPQMFLSDNLIPHKAEEALQITAK
jgi:histone H3/H4